MLMDTSTRPVVFGAMDYVCDTLLRAGSSIIYDANTNRHDHRHARAAKAAEYGARTILITINTPVEIAREREKTRELPPRYDRSTPEHFQEIVDTAESPDADETVITIDGLVPFEQQYQSFCDQLSHLDAA